MLKAIIFDFDGVMVDSEPLHYRAFLLTLQGLGISFNYAQYLQRYVGFDDRDAFVAMLAHAPEPAHPDQATLNRLGEDKAKAFESLVEEGLDVIPGILALIHHVKQEGLPMAIASGATKRDVEPVLERLGLSDQFHPIVTADDVAHSKPDPTTYQLTVQGLAQYQPSLALTPAQCLAIEDTPAGIEAARRAGLKTLGLTTTHAAQMLRGAHRVTDSLEGLNTQQLHLWFD